jgi:hypothetical protein
MILSIKGELEPVSESEYISTLKLDDLGENTQRIVEFQRGELIKKEKVEYISKNDVPENPTYLRPGEYYSYPDAENDGRQKTSERVWLEPANYEILLQAFQSELLGLQRDGWNIDPLVRFACPQITLFQGGMEMKSYELDPYGVQDVYSWKEEPYRPETQQFFTRLVNRGIPACLVSASLMYQIPFMGSRVLQNPSSWFQPNRRVPFLPGTLTGYVKLETLAVPQVNNIPKRYHIPVTLVGERNSEGKDISMQYRPEARSYEDFRNRVLDFMKKLEGAGYVENDFEVTSEILTLAISNEFVRRELEEHREAVSTYFGSYTYLDTYRRSRTLDACINNYSKALVSKMFVKK